MQRKKMAQSGLTGWRKTAAEKIASPVERRTPLTKDQILAALGALSLAIFLFRTITTLRRTAAAGKA